MAFRADGKRVKNGDPMYTVAPFIMDKRYDAMNMITVDIPLAPVKQYINEKRKEGIRLSRMGLLTAAYIRTVYEFPLLNHFIVNKRIYKRNEFPVAMVVLRDLKSQQATMSKVNFELDDTVFEVERKLNEYVEKNKEITSENNTDKMIKFLLSVPGLLSFGVGVIKFLDKHGLLPKFIIDLSPFHAALTITNLASIRTNHIYHHLYEFGTTSVFIALGNSREIPKKRGDEVVLERCMPLGVVMDERICSGSYFAMAFRKFKSYLENPVLLEVKPENSEK